MTPGPVPMPPEALKVLSEPMEHHRTPQFQKTLAETFGKLKKCFQTQNSVFVHSSTGSGAMESALVNTLSPGDEVIVIDSGKFGQRWAKAAKAHRLRVHTHKVPWGLATEVNSVVDLLKSHPEVKAVFCQASETSTATKHPIKELALAIKKQSPQCLFLVDAITALGAMELPMDEWQLDVVVSGSQKAFMLPTGLSFIALSDLAWEYYEKSTCPKFYFDLGHEKKAIQNNETFFSTAVTHIKALNITLNQLTGDGLKKRIQRCESLASLTREFGEKIGYEVFSKAPSPAVTALLVPRGIDGAALRTHIESRYNITLMGGQDELKGKILRMGHLGHITDEDQLAGLEALGRGLMDLGDPNLTEDVLNEHLKAAQKKLMGYD